MDQENDTGYYWPAYVDFMTVLFFIALGIGGLMYLQYARQIQGLKKYQTVFSETVSIIEKLKMEFKEKNIRLDTDAKDKIKLKGDFYFETNQDSLKDQNAKSIIISIGQSIKRVLDVDSNKFKYSIVIEGHTDNRGDEEYNNGLSFRRSASIANIWKNECRLILPDYEIVPAGYGELRPFRPNTDDINRSLNRRIEISINPKMSEFTKLIQQ